MIRKTCVKDIKYYRAIFDDAAESHFFCGFIFKHDYISCGVTINVSEDPTRNGDCGIVISANSGFIRVDVAWEKGLLRGQFS